MARENSIFVRIKADGSSFFSTMKQANASLRTVDKSFKEYGTTVDEQRAKTNALRDSYRELSTGFLTAGAAIMGGLGLMAAKYSQFDKAVSVFDAHAKASVEQLEQLGEVAMETGHKYGISALEAVEAATNLAKAGVSVEEVLGGGLEGALTLAATGNLSVADSAETAAIAMTQFGLSGEDVPHIADLLSAAAGKAVGEVADMSWALRQAGLVANGMGLSIEETTGTLSSFAMAGLIGSDAGTSFKSMLLAIQSPSGVAKKKMEELGLSFYDANGDFIGITDSAQVLQDRLWHLSQEQRNAALSTIFGQDAIRSASILYEEGAVGIQEWINKVNHSGYAAELAEAKLDNLQGDVSKLAVSFENVVFSKGSGFNEFLREAVQVADSFLQVIGQIPAPVFNAGIAIAGIAGAGALGIGAFMKLTVAAADTKDALHTLGIASGKAEGKVSRLSRMGSGLAKFGAYGVGIAFLAAGIASLANTTAPAEIGLSKISNALADTKKGIEPLNAAFRNAEWANGNIKGAMGTVKDINSIGDAVVQLGERSESGLARFEDAGNRFLGVNSQWVKAADDIAAVDESLAGMVSNGNAEHAADQFEEIISSVREAGGDVDAARAQFTGYEAAIRDYATTLGVTLTDQQVFEAMLGNLPPALTDAAGGAEVAAEGIGEMGDAAGEATLELEDLLDAMFQLGLIKMTARDAATAYADALRGTSDAAKEIAESEEYLGRILNDNASDFDLATEAGKLANDSFQGLADAGMEVVKSNAYLDSSYDSVRGNLQTTYDDLKATAEGWGINSEAAADLAAEVLGVPDGVNIDTWMDDQANWVAENTGAAINDIPEQKRVQIDMDAEDVEVGLEQIRVGLGDIPQDKEIRTLVTDNGSIDVVQIGVDNLTGNKVVAEVSDDGTVSDVQYRVDTIEGKTVLVPISDGGTVPATQADVNAMYGKTLQTIVTDEGTIQFTQQEVRDMQGRIIETKVTDDGTIMVVQGGINNIEGSQETILVDDNGTASVVQQDINNVQGRTVYVDIIQRYSSIGEAVSQSKGMLKPGLATGGRLPTTGPGTGTTDGILGVNEAGMPHVRVDAGEWIINSQSSDKHNALLAAINRDDPRLKGLPGFATGGRINGLAARPGEENWQWMSRQDEIVRNLDRVVGEIADWQIHEDGSGWIKLMDDTILRIADGAYTVDESTKRAARSIDGTSGLVRGAGKAANDAANAMHVTAAEANATTGTFTLAGQAANGTAGAFNNAATITQQAAERILAATSALTATGRTRAPAKGGGLTARPGEKDVQWMGRQNAFEASIAKKYGGIKYSDIHEDGSGQIVMDDGRLIELDKGRWKFVSKFKYGAPLHGRQLSRFATGGRLPLTGPGTDKRDGILGVSSLTGAPTAHVDAGEWIVNSRSSEKYDTLLAAINRDDPRLWDLPKHATGGRLDRAATGSSYTPRGVDLGYTQNGGAGITAVVDPAPIAQAVHAAMSEYRPVIKLDNRTIYGSNVRAKKQMERR